VTPKKGDGSGRGTKGEESWEKGKGSAERRRFEQQSYPKQKKERVRNNRNSGSIINGNGERRKAWRTKNRLVDRWHRRQLYCQLRTAERVDEWAMNPKKKIERRGGPLDVKNAK